MRPAPTTDTHCPCICLNDRCSGTSSSTSSGSPFRRASLTGPMRACPTAAFERLSADFSWSRWDSLNTYGHRLISCMRTFCAFFYSQGVEARWLSGGGPLLCPILPVLDFHFTRVKVSSRQHVFPRRAFRARVMRFGVGWNPNSARSPQHRCCFHPFSCWTSCRAWGSSAAAKGATPTAGGRWRLCEPASAQRLSPCKSVRGAGS